MYANSREPMRTTAHQSGAAHACCACAGHDANYQALLSGDDIIACTMSLCECVHRQAAGGSATRTCRVWSMCRPRHHAAARAGAAHAAQRAHAVSATSWQPCTAVATSSADAAAMPGSCCCCCCGGTAAAAAGCRGASQSNGAMCDVSAVLCCRRRHSPGDASSEASAAWWLATMAAAPPSSRLASMGLCATA